MWGVADVDRIEYDAWLPLKFWVEAVFAVSLPVWRGRARRWWEPRWRGGVSLGRSAGGVVKATQLSP